jgi:hypothetical protein
VSTWTPWAAASLAKPTSRRRRPGMTDRSVKDCAQSLATATATPQTHHIERGTSGGITGNATGSDEAADQPFSQVSALTGPKCRSRPS